MERGLQLPPPRDPSGKGRGGASANGGEAAANGGGEAAVNGSGGEGGGGGVGGVGGGGAGGGGGVGGGGGAGAVPLPSSLEDALKALEADEDMVRRLGPTLVRWFVGVKRGEMAALATKEAELLEGLRDSLHERDSRRGGAGGEADEKALELARREAWRHMYLEFL